MISIVIPVYKTPGLTSGRGQNIFNCQYSSPPPPGKVCDVNIKSFQKCTQENNYSYHKNSPCIFLKLNKIYGWIPAFYNDTESLPAKMPKQLTEVIRATKARNPLEVCGMWQFQTIVIFIEPISLFMDFFLFWFLFYLQLNTVWVSCEGENPADVENIGPVEYYPQQGFPGFYYPYENSEGYLSPLVAIHFTRPVREYSPARLEISINDSLV